MFIKEFRLSSRRTTSDNDPEAFHLHPDRHQIIYPHNSVGSFIIDGNEYPYEPDYLYYSPPGVQHYCKNQIGTDYDILYFTVDDAELDQKLNALPYVIAVNNATYIRYLFGQLQLQKSSKSALSEFHQYSYFIMLLNTLLDRTFIPPLMQEYVMLGGADGHAMLNNAFDKLLEFIRTYYRSKMDVDKMCHYSGYQRAQLFRLFKSRLNTTPHQYVNALRAKMARALIESTSMRITDIAYSVGFQSSDALNRIFKQIEGCTPSEYRLRLAAEDKGNKS